jgi:hypothetical protein
MIVPLRGSLCAGARWFIARSGPPIWPLDMMKRVALQ